MPFQSQAQRSYMFANMPAMAKRWAKETPKGKALPLKVRRPEPPKGLEIHGTQRPPMEKKHHPHVPMPGHKGPTLQQMLKRMKA